MTRNVRLAVVRGDGIGTEVVEEGLKVLDAALAGSGVTVSTTEMDLGARRWHATGETLTAEDLATIREHDVILLGAVGDPGVPSGVLERGLLLRLRFELDHYVNLRPGKLYPGVRSPLADPGTIDFVVVREGTEGPYVGNGGSIRKGTPHEVANEVSVNTAFGIERVVRDAYTRAAARPRKHLTLVHKHNVLVHAGDLWLRTVEAMNPEFPDVTIDYLHVDAATIFMVTQPSRFDVIVTDNLFGDDHVEPGRLGDHEDGRRVHVQVVDGDVRELGIHRLDDAPPQVAGVHQHVVLVHERQVPAGPSRCPGVGVPDHALDAERGVDTDLVGDLVRRAGADGPAVTDVGPVGALPHDDEVHLTGVGERRAHAGVQLPGAQVDVVVQLEAQPEQQPALQDAGRDTRVPDGPEQDRVVPADRRQVLGGQRLAGRVPAAGAEVHL